MRYDDATGAEGKWARLGPRDARWATVPAELRAALAGYAARAAAQVARGPRGKYVVLRLPRAPDAALRALVGALALGAATGRAVVVNGTAGALEAAVDAPRDVGASVRETPYVFRFFSTLEARISVTVWGLILAPSLGPSEHSSSRSGHKSRSHRLVHSHVEAKLTGFPGHRSDVGRAAVVGREGRGPRPST